MLANEGAIRFAVFIGGLALMLGWEALAPRRPLIARAPLARLFRYGRNIGLAALGTLLLRLAFPLLAVALAERLTAHGVGLLNAVDLPAWLEALIAFVLLDFVIYFQHVLFHSVPALWRFHMVHHADLDFDTTTGVRFHPIEIALSMGIKLGVVAVLGAPAIAVFLFEIVLNATSLFNHGNVRLPLGLDRGLRLLIVTPDMHRVHHSVIACETNSNYGFNLSLWDRLFRSYRAQPTGGHDGMTIGLRQFAAPERLTLPWLLVLPFVAGTRLYPAAPRAHLDGERGALLSGRALGRLLAVALIATGIGLVAHHRGDIDVAAIETWLAGFGALAPILFIVAYTIGVTVFVPATLLTLAGGMLFGPVWGTVYNLAAATIAATLMMLIARYVAGDFIATRTARWLRAIMAGVNEEGWRFVFLMRLIPGIPFAVLNYALGLTRIRLGPYALATLIGMVPAAIVINYVGYAGREAALGGEALAEKALIGLGALAALALVTRLVLRLRRRRRAMARPDAPRDTPR